MVGGGVGCRRLRPPRGNAAAYGIRRGNRRRHDGKIHFFLSGIQHRRQNRQAGGQSGWRQSRTDLSGRPRPEHRTYSGRRPAARQHENSRRRQAHLGYVPADHVRRQGGMGVWTGRKKRRVSERAALQAASRPAPRLLVPPHRSAKCRIHRHHSGRQGLLAASGQPGVEVENLPAHPLHRCLSRLHAGVYTHFQLETARSRPGPGRPLRPAEESRLSRQDHR